MGDCLVIADGTLSVIYMKYGLGILVDAHQNPQMMCYATTDSFLVVHRLDTENMLKCLYT